MVGITHSLLSREIKRKFNFLVSAYSTPEDIERIIENVCMTEEKDSERMELTRGSGVVPWQGANQISG